MAIRTYKGRTQEEQKAFNKARREAVQAAKDKASQGEDMSSVLDDFQPQIEAEDVQIPQLSWQDRLLSKINGGWGDDGDSPPTTKAGKEHVEKSSGLISHVLPMTISGLVAIYSQKLFSEPYKVCAPSKEEVSTMILPLFSVIHRHTKIEGKASQDAIDITAFFLASITIGTRMLMTAERIRQDGLQGSNHQEQNTTPINLRTRTSTNSAEQSTTDSRSGRSTNGSQAARDGNDDIPGVHDAAIDGSSEAEIVAHLFKRDTEGRRKMGLAPRRFSESS